MLALLFTRLSSSIETAHSDSARTWFHLGLHRSRRVVLKLSALFGLDAFAGGFVVQSLIAYWFHTRFGAQPAALAEIDRVGSAWLIHRFIDAGAKFVFANTPAEFPEAIPYDMFEVEFSHQGDRCTFETLIERFGIRDKAVLPIAHQ